MEMTYLLEAVGLRRPRRGTLGVLARYADPRSLLKAAAEVRDKGYSKFDCHTPFPVHGLDEAMGMRPSILGFLVFASGSVGCCVALLLQWWASTGSYPIVISGKPIFSLPAYIPVTFELTILFSAFMAVFGMLALNQLPRLHHPVFYSEQIKQATDDAFFISIEAEDPLFDEEKTGAFLESIGGTNVEILKSHE